MKLLFDWSRLFKLDKFTHYNLHIHIRFHTHTFMHYCEYCQTGIIFVSVCFIASRTSQLNKKPTQNTCLCRCHDLRLFFLTRDKNWHEKAWQIDTFLVISLVFCYWLPNFLGCLVIENGLMTWHPIFFLQIFIRFADAGHNFWEFPILWCLR